MNKTIIIGAVVILVLFGIMALGRPQQASVPNPAQAATSVLKTSENFHDFGTISMAKGLVNYPFTITNSTSEDITIDSVTTSCMCTSAYLVNGQSKKGPFGMPGMGYVPRANELVKAGETRTVDVVYNPAAHGPAGVGPIDRFVYVQDSKGGVVTFEIKAVVTP